MTTNDNGMCSNKYYNEPNQVGGSVSTKSMDPWEHRSAKMKCLTCMWFVKKGNAVDQIGRCRRHAPTMGGYPVVFQTDWCGDHKLDETKISEG